MAHRRGAGALGGEPTQEYARAASGGTAADGTGMPASPTRSTTLGGTMRPNDEDDMMMPVVAKRVHRSWWRAAWSSFLLSDAYVRSSRKRDRTSHQIGICTVALVVGFCALLLSAVQYAPILFSSFAQDQVGDTDLVLVAELSDANNVPFVNATTITDRLASDPLVLGAAPRWYSLAKLFNTETPTQNTSAIILVINSELEQQIQIGRGWNRRRLGQQESYISNTALWELGVRANYGERVRMNIDIIGMLAQMGGAFGGIAALDSPAAARAFLISQGFDLLSPIPVNTSIILQAMSAVIGLPNNIIPIIGLPPVVYIDPGVLFNVIYPQLRAALVINQELIVLDGIDSPQGKWSPLLGNVAVLEASYVAMLLRQTMQNVINVLGNGLFPGLPGFNNNGGLATLRQTANSFDETRLAQFAMQVIVQYRYRDEAYLASSAQLKQHMIRFTDAVFTDLTPDFPVTPTTPIATSLVGTTSFITLFLDQIFNATVFLMTLLGCMAIYALVISDVEAKTYEYGMLRAMGMRQTLLSEILLVTTTYFSVPGIVLGLIVACILNIAVVLGVLFVSQSQIPWVLHPASWVFGIILGSVMPAIANIVPIQRALSSVLRDSLDLYHQTFSEVSVQVQRLAELGLSSGQTALAIMLIIIGIATYYILPLAFVFQNFSLFLGLLNAVLLGMLLGLSLIAQALQPFLERLVLNMVVCCRDRRLITVVRKNLAGHQQRNRKTAYMITIAMSFLIFAGAMFSLLSATVTDSVSLAVGADVVGLSPTTKLALPQQALSNFLDAMKTSTALRPALVTSYTFITFPMRGVKTVANTRASNLVSVPNPRQTLFGVQSNFNDVAYNQFSITTEVSPLTNGDTNPYTNDPVGLLYAGAGDLKLSIEKQGLGLPAPVVSGFANSLAYLCNNSLAFTNPTECKQNCGTGGTCTEYSGATMTNLAIGLASSYYDYVDVLMTEAMRSWASVNVDVPVRLIIDAWNSATRISGATVYLAKIRAMVRKLPGFFFSSYSQTAVNGPMIVTMPRYEQLLADAAEATGATLTGASADQSSTAAASASGDGSTQAGTGAGSTTGPNSRPVIPVTPWVASSPFWETSFTGAMLSNHDAALALDGDKTTYAAFSQPGPAVIAFDAGNCYRVDGFAIWNNFTASDVRDYTLEWGASLSGPWVHVADVAPLNSNTLHGWRNVSFVSQTSRIWRISVTKTIGTSNVARIIDMRLRGTLATSCPGFPATYNEAALAVPKQRILVKLAPGISAQQRQVVLNGMRNTLPSDLIRVQDTASLLDSAGAATLGLTLFFDVVAVLCITLIFFASVVSFRANIRENSREFGVLRALGLTVEQVIRVYVYEAFVVVAASLALGAGIGFLISISLTLQFDLFTEMPFQFQFPVIVFITTVVLLILTAFGASILPAKRLIKISISNVLKGRDQS